MTKPKTEPLQIRARKGIPEVRLLAEVATDPAVTAGYLANIFGKGIMGESDLTHLVDIVRERAATVRGGNLADLENVLTAQTTALNAIFGELARRSALNLGEYIDAADRYLRLALKAQAQCRATIETLATIKNPPVVIAKQANFAAGPQQVNNGAIDSGSRASIPGIVPNELLEVQSDTSERLDLGAAGSSIGGDPGLETMGAVNRPADL